jgi:hypothetical protein
MQKAEGVFHVRVNALKFTASALLKNLISTSFSEQNNLSSSMEDTRPDLITSLLNLVGIMR